MIGAKQSIKRMGSGLSSAAHWEGFMIKDEELKMVYEIFTASWRFYKKYADVQQSDEYWKAVMDEARQIVEQYNNSKLAIDLIIATMNEIERKTSKK